MEMDGKIIMDLESLYGTELKNSYNKGNSWLLNGGLEFGISARLPFGASVIFYGANPRSICDMKNIGDACFAFTQEKIAA